MTQRDRHHDMESIEQKKFSIGARLRSFRHAFRGIGLLVRREHNARIHLAATVLVILAGLCFRLSWAEWAVLVFAMGFVWAAEAFNSAVERLSDRVTSERDPMIRDAKDLAAGAVLISAVVAVVVGLIVFVPRIWLLFQ